MKTSGLRCGECLTVQCDTPSPALPLDGQQKWCVVHTVTRILHSARQGQALRRAAFGVRAPESSSIKRLREGFCPRGVLGLSELGLLSFFIEHSEEVKQEHETCHKAKHNCCIFS